MCCTTEAGENVPDSASEMSLPQVSATSGTTGLSFGQAGPRKQRKSKAERKQRREAALKCVTTDATVPKTQVNLSSIQKTIEVVRKPVES